MYISSPSTVLYISYVFKLKLTYNKEKLFLLKKGSHDWKTETENKQMEHI